MRSRPTVLLAVDVAFPVLNSVSFWLTASGALLINASLVIGNFARTGWMGYPPLSELAFSPDVGVDYYLWSLQISGIGTLLAGINLVIMVNVAIVVETVFAWPGIGRLLYEGITFRDFPVVQGVVIMSGAMIVTVNLLVDILYAVIDPRIRLER